MTKINNYCEIMKPASRRWHKQFVKWLSRNWTEDMKIIDLGCGDETLTNELAYIGFKSDALDYPEIDLEKPFNFKEKYDVIILKFVLEHINNTIQLFESCYKSLKPTGKLIVLTDDSPVDWDGFLEDPTHITPFTLNRLTNLGAMTGFQELECRSWRNLPYIWRWWAFAFNYVWINPKQLFGVFVK